jgi:hypothetical protein
MVQYGERIRELVFHAQIQEGPQGIPLLAIYGLMLKLGRPGSVRHLARLARLGGRRQPRHHGCFDGFDHVLTFPLSLVFVFFSSANQILQNKLTKSINVPS